MGQIQKKNVQIHFQIQKLLNQIGSAFIKIPYFHVTYVFAFFITNYFLHFKKKIRNMCFPTFCHGNSLIQNAF